MASIDPFDDVYRMPSDRNTNIYNPSVFSDATKAPVVHTLSPFPSCNFTCSASTEQRPHPSSPPLAWTAADLGKLSFVAMHAPSQSLTSSDYFLAAILPDQMIAGEVVLEQHMGHSKGFASSFCIELYLRTMSQPAISASAYSATAPIGTGRPVMKVLIADGTGENLPAARRALAEDILSCGITPTYVMKYHSFLSHLYRLPMAALSSVRRGVEGMGKVTDTEWMGRLTQLKEVEIDTAPWSEARLEIFLLENGVSNLKRWARVVDMAISLGQEDRDLWADTHSNAILFLHRIVAELGVGWLGRGKS